GRARSISGSSASASFSCSRRFGLIVRGFSGQQRSRSSGCSASAETGEDGSGERAVSFRDITATSYRAINGSRLALVGYVVELTVAELGRAPDEKQSS